MVFSDITNNRQLAAARLGVARQTLHRLLAGQQRVSAGIALRLGRLCGNGPEIWLNLQAQYDWALARERSGAQIEAVKPLTQSVRPRAEGVEYWRKGELTGGARFG